MKSKRIEETYYVTFEDNYLKKYQKTNYPAKGIFPSTNPMEISNLYEEFMNLFDEPEKAIYS